jgi:hypothetical protein
MHAGKYIIGITRINRNIIRPSITPIIIGSKLVISVKREDAFEKLANY